MNQSPFPSVSASERRWVLRFAVITLLITTLPYLIGYYTQGEDWRFTGFVFGVEDGNTYIGKMLRGASGDWLFRTPYTASEQSGALIFVHYILLGKLTSPPGQHEQLVALYHLFRIVGGILSIAATYDFLALFLREMRSRKFGVVLATYGGGLGWILVLLGRNNWLGSLPLDFYSPETFGFLGLYGIAHLPWARAFFLWGLRAYLIRGRGEKDIPCATLRLGNLHPGMLWLLTGIAQPITGMVVGAVAGIHLVGLGLWQAVRSIRKTATDWPGVARYWKIALVSGLMASPLVLYNLLAFTRDPYLKIWVAQSRIPAPHGLHYLLAYGLILPFSIVGAVFLVKARSLSGWLPVSWAALTPVLLSVPFSLQRRLVEGLWVALVLLAFVAYEHISRKNFRLSFGFLVLTLPSTLFLFTGGIMAAASLQAPVFRQRDQVVAYEFLAQSAEEKTVVLSSYQTGNALPAWAPVFVVIGHGPESAGLAQVEPRVRAFYRAETSDQDRLALLSEFGVDYVFWGPGERAYGSWSPEKVVYLDSVFQQGDYQIFRVDPP